MSNLFKSFLAGIAFIAVVLIANAQNPFDIKFPIAELGNCDSLEACAAFCDKPENVEACVAWAEKNGFSQKGDRSKENRGRGEEQRHEDDFEVKVHKLLAKQDGPGGCKTFEQCDAYCSQDEHQEECFNFALEHNLLPPEEADRIKKQQEAIKQGPGGCRSHEECEAFCRRPENTRVCINFAVKEGFMTQEEADISIAEIERFEKFRQGPPGHGEQPGFQGDGRGPRGPQGPRRGPRGTKIEEPHPEIDVEKAQQVLEQLGGGPGGCKTVEECEVFCEKPENGEICFQFAIEHGLIDSSEADKFKKLMTAEGPGGCRGRQCEQFCEQPGHEEECLNFAVEHGLLAKEHAEEARRFINAAKDGGPGGCRGRQCEQFCADPAHQDECLEFAKKHNLIPKEELENVERMKNRMKQGGPGGCKNEDECHIYCGDPSHSEECLNFAAEMGMMPKEETERMKREMERFKHMEEEFKSGRLQGGPGGLRELPPQGGAFGPRGFGADGIPPGEFEGIKKMIKEGRLPESMSPEAAEKFKRLMEEDKLEGMTVQDMERMMREMRSRDRQIPQQQFEGELQRRYGEQYNKQFDVEYQRRVQELKNKIEQTAREGGTIDEATLRELRELQGYFKPGAFGDPQHRSQQGTAPFGAPTQPNFQGGTQFVPGQHQTGSFVPGEGGVPQQGFIPEGFRPPEGFVPPAGGTNPNLEQQFQNQYQEQYKQQYQQQFEQQYQQFNQEPTQPPLFEQPPPQDTTAPQGRLTLPRLIANVLQAFVELFRL